MSSQVDPPPAAQVEAMMRLLVESGDMTPMAVRQLRSVLPRVAVVRPARPTREEIATMIEGAERARPRERWALTAADDILDASIGAVVRPTRDQIARCITTAKTAYWMLRPPIQTETSWIADALLAEFWPGFSRGRLNDD